MTIWIQSLSWALIYSLAQGFMVFASLWLVLKLVPSIRANVKYHLSLSALTILLAWFVTTWWQQFHSLTLTNDLLVAAGQHIDAQRSILTIHGPEDRSIYYSIMATLKPILPWLSAFYLVGLALMLVRLSAGMLQVFSLRASGITPPEAAIGDLLVSLKSRLQFQGSVQLFISAKARVPMVIGFIKPVILMPAAAMAQLSTEQLETILLHELAHIKRYDYLVNMLQTVAETILFFNPFVWLISSVTRREREHCCDDLVLEHTNEPLFYATALAAVASGAPAVSSFTIAASGRPGHLFSRIRRIMETQKNPFSYSRMIAAIFIVAAITCSIAWLSPFANTKKQKPVATAMPAPETTAPVSAEQQEISQLVQRLINDHFISESDGFVVEKYDNRLLINGRQQSNEIAGKYLENIKQAEIKIRVFSFSERMKMHPDATMIELLVPVQAASGCVDYNAKKPGC